MIIVRVGLARDHSLSSRSTHSVQQSGLPLSHRSSFGGGISGGGGGGGGRHSRPPYNGQSLAVEITQFIETDGDDDVDVTPIELKVGEERKGKLVREEEEERGRGFKV